MKVIKFPLYVALGIISLSLFLTGCTVTFQTRHRSDVERIDSLNTEIDALNAKLLALNKKKETEISQLEEAKKLLEKRLEKEIRGKEVRVEMAEKGLTIVFVAEVLFDSGKADIKSEAFPALDKVAKVLNENIGDRFIGIEGYTDNDPIKYSGWKSNWELSTGRATSVLHYLVDQKGTSPKRVSATGYGEYRPVASNDTKEGKRQNRRVEIVVLPKNIEKIQADIDEVVEQKRKIQRQLEKYKK